MSAAEIKALLPLILLTAGMLVVLIAVSFRRDETVLHGFTLSGLALSFAYLFVAAGSTPARVSALFLIDRYALVFTGLFIGAAFVIQCLSYGYLKRRGSNRGEFPLLLLLATIGSAVIVSSSHFVSFFLGLEVLSVSLYVLISFTRTDEHGIEAGIKYLVLASFSSAFLLFGMALVYMELGTMAFAEIAVKTAAHAQSVPFAAGLVLILAGIAFKLAVVPFHIWSPDVYEGAPAPVSAYIATVSKGAIFGLILRYFAGVWDHAGLMHILLPAIAVASMLVGNLLALFQQNLKRILAYSSIAHMGYLLVALQAFSRLGATAATFYLAAYFLATLGAFGVVTVLSGAREADGLEDYEGLITRRPQLAWFLVIMLLSLAGLPVTAGFIGKFALVAAGAGSGLWLQLVVLAVGSVIGLFYYLRVISALFAGGRHRKSTAGERLSLQEGLTLAVILVLLLLLGVYPAPLFGFIQASVSGLM